MSHNVEMEALGFEFNPFPPAATGASLSEKIWLPTNWSEELQNGINGLATGRGSKALTVVGEYGSGKTYVLQWLMMHVFRQRRILPFFFDNPGVAFYDLANQLLRQVGRYEFSKSMWELLYLPEADSSLQGRLVELTFPQWLANLGDRKARKREVDYLARSLRERDLTDDEEVSFRFAQLIVDTRDRPYFEFRDFIPRLANSLVPEREEARYFVTVIRILMQIFEASGVAFLIDEFEDVALGRRLARKQVSEYTATLRRLLDTARDEELWLAVSITPEGLEQTSRLEPALIQRFSSRFVIPRLTDSDAFDLVLHRMNEARSKSLRKDLWPFENDVLLAMEERNRSTPRKLIRILWQSLALASQKGIEPPFSKSLIAEAEQLLSNE